MKKLSAIQLFIFSLFLLVVLTISSKNVAAVTIFKPPLEFSLPTVTPTPTIKIFKIPPKIFLTTPTPTSSLTPSFSPTPTPSIVLTPTEITPMASVSPEISPEISEKPEDVASASSKAPFIFGLSKREAGLVAIVAILTLVLIGKKLWLRIKTEL